MKDGQNLSLINANLSALCTH